LFEKWMTTMISHAHCHHFVVVVVVVVVDLPKIRFVCVAVLGAVC